ncbi:MAG: AraC family transcriptional regulator [Victivallaceae bacterium]
MELVERLRFNPIPRGANFRSDLAFQMGPRHIYAHQLVYVFAGSGTGRFDDTEFRLEPGVLAVYGPVTRHEFRNDPGIALTVTTMCFSCREVSDRQLSVGNRGEGELTPEFWTCADEPVRIEGLPPFPFFIRLEEPQRRVLEPLFREIGLAWKQTPHAPLLVLRAKAILLEVVLQLHKQLAAAAPPEPLPVSRFRQYIARHYASDIVRRDAADAIGVSESHLTWLLIRHLDSNFTACLTRVRLRAAAELLQYSTLSVKEIAAAVGFSSASYFIVRFRQCYGVSPNHARYGVEAER